MSASDTEALDAAAEDALGSIREMLQQPTRLAPFAIVLGEKGIATLPILDLSERIHALRFAVEKVTGYAFVLFYEGVVGTPSNGTPHEALFRIQMTSDGAGRALAYPYRRFEGTTQLDDPVEHDGSLEWMFRAVFGLTAGQVY